MLVASDMGINERISKSNSKLTRAVFAWLLVAFVIALLIPIDGIPEKYLELAPRWVIAITPSIRDLSQVSTIPAAVHSYAVISALLCPIAVLSMVPFVALRDRFITALKKRTSRGYRVVLIVYFLYIPMVVLLIMVFGFREYNYGAVDGNTWGESLFLTMVNSRLGLAVLGSCLLVGLVINLIGLLVYLLGPITLLFTEKQSNDRYDSAI